MKWNLRTKILVTCLCSALGALLLQTLLFQNASSSLIYRQAEMESYNSLQNMQNELETFFRGIETGIIEIYNDQEYLKDLSGDYDLASLQDKYYRRAKLLATDKFATSDNVLALYLYTEKHEIVSTYRKNMTPHRKYPKDIYEDPKAYNADVVKRYVESDDNRMMISSYQSPYSNKTIIRFVEKIHNMNKLDERIGYVICDVDIKVIEKIMSKYTVSDNTYIWLQPTGDQMICVLDNPDKTNQEYFEQLCEYIQQGRTEEIDSIEKAGNELFSVGQKKYNLTAYEIMPQSLLKQNQMLLTRNLIVIAITLTVILTLLTLYLTRILTKPLENLTDTVTKISEGNTELRVDYTKTDEIGNLGEQFNHMLDEIQLLVGKEYEQRLLLEQAEYKALQAQINPHFLYNTLDTMSSIASIQDCEIVSQLCQSLSSIFRYSLDMKHPYSTVAKEINHLKNYIFVMNVRMRGDIVYQFHIDDDALADSIPRISLQPLVENAINHGLKNKHGEKTVDIAVHIKGDILELSVTDNGVGMDDEEVNRRLQENDTAKIEEGNSIGIYNINARMKKLYGSEYGIKVESKAGVGTKVLIQIPRKTISEVSVHDEANI